jgi:Fucose permease
LKSAPVRENPSSTGGIAAVYGAGLLQGLTLVSFPASSAVLRAAHGFTDAQYGSIFLPQVALAIVGSLIGGALAARIGLRGLLIAALLTNLLSQLLLAGSLAFSPDNAFLAVLLGTGSMGLGFGLLGAPMNTYPALLFPARSDSALVAIHTLVGVGLCIGPLLLKAFVDAGLWVGFPLLLVAMAAALTGPALIAPLPRPMPLSSQRIEASGRPLRSPVLWVFVLIAFLYAFAEGTFSNWIVVYLTDGKGLSADVGGWALSAFWGALVLGRLAASALVLRMPASRIWIVLPVVMSITLLLLPQASTPVLGIGLFVLAGLACSAFFPLSIALVSQRFPQQVALVSSLMIAALMSGVGLGSFLLGALRGGLSFEQLYAYSAIYPALVFALGLWVLRGSRALPAKT